ncbi:MAG: 50S ribosomal protein L9 [Firmicutes bacterium]|nr:50S ribosomal protein L9 [Bacillota bacterium]
MKVVLLKDVPGQGKRGDVVNVAEGYARNYLIPRGLAAVASEGKLKELSAQKEAAAQKNRRLEEDARAMAGRLKDLKVIIRTKTGEGGRLFGSVNNKDIADAIAAQHKIVLDKKKLVVKEPIKQLGTYTVTARLHPSVQAEISVEVTGE